MRVRVRESEKNTIKNVQRSQAESRLWSESFWDEKPTLITFHMGFCISVVDTHIFKSLSRLFFSSSSPVGRLATLHIFHRTRAARRVSRGGGDSHYKTIMQCIRSDTSSHIHLHGQ